jgi:hypothetical protein
VARAAKVCHRGFGRPGCTSLFCHIFSKGLGSRAAQRDSTIAS